MSNSAFKKTSVSLDSPVFTTKITTPVLVGGSGSTATVTIKGTSSGTTTSSIVALQPTGGNVGIGTTTPASPLHIIGASADIYNGQLQVVDNASYATGVGGRLVFSGKYASNSGVAAFSSIAGVKENATDYNYLGALSFSTRNVTSGMREVMRLDSNGILSLNNPEFIGGMGYAVKYAAAPTTYRIGWELGPTTRTMDFYSIFASGGLGFNFITGTNATNSSKMSIRDTGNVGIGLTGADLTEKLTIYGGNILIRTPLAANGVMGKIGFGPGENYTTGPTSYMIGKFEGSAWYNGSGLGFFTNAGPDITAQNPTQKMYLSAAGNLSITGALSKGSGSFNIEHPLESKRLTHRLVHSFIEGPQADLIYRGKTKLINGMAIINIDEVAGMTEGTFILLCREVQCFTTNETGWDAIKGSVSGNTLTIISQNPNSTDEISWMVIGERKDKHIMNTEWTDENGKVIVEPEIIAEPEVGTKIIPESEVINSKL